MTLDLVYLAPILFLGIAFLIWLARQFRGDWERPCERPGGIIEEVLQANQMYAGHHAKRNLSPRPTRKLAVVTCMDCRLHLEELLCLRPGEAHIVRNAGGIVTDDVLRSLIVSHHLLGTEEILLIHHTECGMLTFQDERLRDHLIRKTGKTTAEPACFHAFRDLRLSLRAQIGKVKAHPWIPASVVVRGCVYDVRTGLLTEVTAEVGSAPRLTSRSAG